MDKEKQLNVPISQSYHGRLKRIASIDGISMKHVVEKWIEIDGRGKIETVQKPIAAMSLSPGTD
jgi:hypothetical protein